MSTITTINATDKLKNSRSDLNTNFSNLNTDKLEKAGDTMSGQLNFSGSDHSGIKLLSLTTAQRDALSAANGMVIYNSSTNAVQCYANGTWVTLGEEATGTLKLWATDTPPTGWLLADGSAVSRTTYSSLFGIISTTYGAGDGSTTFNLPNLKGKVPVGKNASETEFDTLGETGGAKTHQLTEAELASHKHGFMTQPNSYSTTGAPSGGGASSGVYQRTSSGGNGIDTASFIDNAGSGVAHNNLQPYLVLNYIIKY
jgi:microcystin-dependent protein